MKTYHGSCHCGAVKFEADIDPGAGTRKCNCSYCTKARNWFALIPPDCFRLSGKPDLTDYQFGKKTLIHRFCSACGIHPFGSSDPKVVPAEKGWVYVNLTCLDDVTSAELSNAPVKAVDGRHDNYELELADDSTL